MGLGSPLAELCRCDLSGVQFAAQPGKQQLVHVGFLGYAERLRFDEQIVWDDYGGFGKSAIPRFCCLPCYRIYVTHE